MGASVRGDHTVVCADHTDSTVLPGRTFPVLDPACGQEQQVQSHRLGRTGRSMSCQGTQIHHAAGTQLSLTAGKS